MHGAATIYVDAPVVNDSFFIAAYDAKNGLGKILAAANVSKPIAHCQNNVVSKVAETIHVTLTKTIIN